MSSVDFDSLFDSFHSTVVRLETLAGYLVEDEVERIEAFKAGAPRPERSVRTNPWLARIAVTTVGGKSWSRVRVVDTPLTEYQRYQLAGYIESQAVGEQIRVARRAEVDDVGLDFWLFDSELDTAYAALMHYDDDGRFEGAEVVREPMLLAGLAARVDAVAARAAPFNEFLATAVG